MAGRSLKRIDTVDSAYELSRAIREKTGGGYGFHRMWKSLIEWVRNAPEF